MTALERLAHTLTCPECNAAPGALCVDVKPVLHLARYDAARAFIAGAHGPQTMPAAPVKPANHFHDCSRCGQTVITREAVPMCATCRTIERRQQGETVRLFEPAPAQIPGQMAF